MKIRQKILSSVLMIVMLLAMCSTVFAAGASSGSVNKVSAASYQDVDAITELPIDYTQSAQIPLEGWYCKTLESGRTVKMYIPEYAACRAYFTVVAAPAGVKDIQAWAEKQGYTDLMEERGEVLAVLEADKKWTDLETELAYVTEAMNFVNSGKNANGITLFTNYSTFYLIGYEGGAAPLEAWSAEHPILVDSQVFINGKSAGYQYLSEVGQKIYDGTNTGGYDPGIADLDEFEKVLAEHGYEGKAITRSEVAVPTWFVNYSSFDYSVRYWKSANDCKVIPNGFLLNRTYWQSKDSDAFQTEYANSCTEENHGISQVKMSYALYVPAEQLGDFLYSYSRYNVPFAYSNHLSERQDYTAVRVAAQKAAQSGEYLTDDQKVLYDEPIMSDAGVAYDGYYVLAREQGAVGEGTMESGIVAFSDDTNDGVLDAREYLMYIPDCAKGTKAPVVVQYPGMTQSVAVGFDSTQWWRVANEEGVVIIIIGEAYNNSVTLTHKNSDMAYYCVTDILAKEIDGKVVDIDWERIYGSGHSLGSAQVQTFAQTHPEFFAAVASTSFGSNNTTGKYEAVPTMLVIGQSDLPFLMDDLWTSARLKNWFTYLAKADNLKVTEAAPDNADAKVEGSARTYMYTWNNEQEIPMVQWGQTYLREHNCYPAEIPMSWDFISKYKRTADGDRYYSESGFDKDDAVEIESKYDNDDVAKIQAYTDETIYGTGVVEVEVTYNDGVDVSGITAEDYILEDRGSLNPDFGEVKIDSVSVNGQVVTLKISDETQATANNKLIYSGTNPEGVRERNAFGIYNTGSWYRDENGVIHYGKSDTDLYENNTTGMGYQARKSLELQLRHVGEAEAAEECLADEKGQYNEESKWAPTVDRQFGEGGFQDLYDLQIPSTAAPATDGTGDAYVQGYYYVPENYDPANGIVFTLQGNGISYWKIADGCDNKGCGITYDSATTSWANKGAIVVNIHDRSGFGKGQYRDFYDFVVDDVNVMKYFLEKYHVTGTIALQGNSRGTSASSSVIQALAGCEYKKNGSGELVTLDKEVYDFQIDTFICQNGMLGRNIWTDEDYETIAKTGLKVWVFDGEQDTNNIDTVTKYTAAAKAVGYSDAWIAENIRHTAYPSEIYAYWGESDHSTTRINGWYFDDAAYYGPDLQIVDGKIVYNTKLNDGDKYTVLARGASRDGGMEKTDHEYVIYDDLYQEWALLPKTKTPVSLDGQPAPCYDYSDANQLPMTGFFSKTLNYKDTNGADASREVYIYISENASCRPYFYVIALPEGAEAGAFLEENGWFEKAEEQGECLFVIAAGKDGYGTADEEMPFMNAAMSWLNTPKADAPDPDHAKNVNYWSAFGEWYFIGYGEGAAPLEAWAAKNPIFVIAQAYVDGETAGSEYLKAVGAETYPVGTNGYDITEDVKTRLGGEDNMIKRGQIPVPTLYAGAAKEESVAYWKEANHVDGGKADEVYTTVYTQNAETWQTQYAGNISKVAVADKALTTEQIFDFITYYTRYDNTSAYGNALMRRVDYTDVIVAAHESEDLYAEQKITTPDGQTGTMIDTVVEIAGELREIMFYMPDSAAELQKDGAPVITVWAGGSQTNIIFFDSTCWWETANKEGIALIFANEHYNTSVAVTPAECDACYKTMVSMMKEWDAEGKFDFDFTRIYSTGQSMGSMESQQFAQETPEYYAAVASTSFYQDYPDTQSGKSIPTYLSNGEGNGKDDSGTMWDDRWNRADQWAMYFLTVNGFEYQNPVYDAEGNMTQLGVPISEAVKTVTGPYDRFETYTWNQDGIPIMQYTNALYRPHNCLTSEIPMLWDFLEHYRIAEDGTRYYSESAFKADDSVEILEQIADFDDVTELNIDWSQAAQLPLTGYFNKDIAVGEETRSVKVYISDTASIRSYFTVVAVPNGVNTKKFLEEEGWFDVADEKGEGLFVLEPGKDGWGSAEEETAYVNAAISFLKGTKNANNISVFSTFGEFYLAGYGEGAAPLEAWAVSNPIFVISQVYLNGGSLAQTTLDELGSVAYGKDQFSTDDLMADIQNAGVGDNREIYRKDVPVPTWFVGNYAGTAADVTYWMQANDILGTKDGDSFRQDVNSTAYQTLYANSKILEADPAAKYGISEVKMTNDAPKAADVYAWLAIYTRYDNSFAYSNALAYRMDYTAAKVAVQKDAEDGEVAYVTPDGVEVLAAADVIIDGHGLFQFGIFNGSDLSGDGKKDPREYLMFIPEGYEGKKLPIMYAYPGGSQSDIIFMDSTQWWQVAEKEGFAVVITCETYGSATGITHKDSNVFQESVVSILKDMVDGKYASLDFTRQYGTGQSQGSLTTQGFATTNPEYYAAVASTSGIGGDGTGVGQLIPTSMITGQSDMSDMLPSVFEGQDKFKNWAKYLIKVNGVNGDLEGGYATAFAQGRTDLYQWSNDDGIVLFQWGQTRLRHHNCYPSDMLECWAFAKKFSMDEDGNRYYSESGFEKDDAVKIYDPYALQEQVTSIQATTEPNFYGHKVSTVEITFAEDTDAADLENARFTLYDRGSANPQFGKVKVTDVEVKGKTVILTVDQGSDKVTDRSRNSFGTLNTTGWYADLEGNIYCGTEQTTDALGKTIYPNTAKKTCQPRELDLILCINGTDLTKGIMSTDGVGHKLADTVWQDTIKIGLDEIKTEMVDVGWEAAGYTLVNDEGKVPVQVIYPEGYDVNRKEAYPVVVYQCGGGVCYWELTDTSVEGVLAPAHNLGCNTVYDNMMTEWHAEFPEAVVMAVNVHSTDTPNAAKEIAGVLDYGIENWNLDKDKILIVGNSQGTIIGSDVIRQRPDLIGAYLECNGNFGTNIAVTGTDGTLANSSLGSWTEEEVNNIIANNVAVWMFNGETDGNNPGVQQDTIKVYSDLFRKAGKSEQWIADHVRASGLQSWKFKEWGETDHSVTKVVAWNYIANPYNDPNEDGKTLAVGDTYKFAGKEENYAYYDYTMDYDYTVYAESVAEWVKKLFKGEYDPFEKQQQVITSIESGDYVGKIINLQAATSGDGKLTFASSNKKVAKVNKCGILTVKKAGTVTITIKASETDDYKAAVKKITLNVNPSKK